MKKILSFPFHPILLAIYPVFALLSFNVGQVEVWAAWRSLLIITLAVLILFGLFLLVFRPAPKAALITSYLVILFFSYGHIHELLVNAKGLIFELSHHKYLGSTFIILAAVGCSLIFKKGHEFGTITRILNVAAISAVLLTIIPIITFSIKLEQSKRENQARVTPEISFTGSAQDMPDIYYIILDSYTRADSLERNFNYDNSQFIQELEKMGFMIGNCSRSNYGFTEVSLASSLNLDYLPALSDQMKPGNGDLTPATALIQTNYVRQQLELLGYKTVAFETGYAWNQWTDANLYLTPNTNPLLIAELQPFEEMLIRSTALRLAADTDKKFLTGSVRSLKVSHHELHVKRTLFILKWLEKMPSIAGPKFVYAHINVPHVPFIFKSDGTLVEDLNFYRGDEDYPINEQYFQEGYINQIEFLNNRIPDIMSKIINESNRPVVIILQGDHGIRDENRLEILNAIYLLGSDFKMESKATPVNTFRLIFDELFNGEFPLLANRGYLSTYELPYDFTEIPEYSEECK